jgi:AraC-like DNA-binding protein
MSVRVLPSQILLDGEGSVVPAFRLAEIAGGDPGFPPSRARQWRTEMRNLALQEMPVSRLDPAGDVLGGKTIADAHGENAVVALQRLGEAFDMDAEAARQWAAQAAMLFAAHRKAGRRSGAGLAPWQALRVARHVDVNLSDRLCVSDMARIAGLSLSHFSRAFARHFSQSPRAYIISCRVEEAKRLMTTTDLRLSQIALDCGFADQAHLSRLFRRLVGVSPLIWRGLETERKACGAHGGDAIAI